MVAVVSFSSEQRILLDDYIFKLVFQMLSVSSELSDLNGRLAAVEREILELSGSLGPQTFTTVADIKRTLIHSSHSYLREAVEALTTDCGALESSIEKVTSTTAPVLQDVERLDSLSQRLDSVLVLVRANLRLRRLVQAASRLQIRCEAEGYPMILLEESVALFREGVELENSLNTQNNAEIAQLSTELRGLRERVQGVVDQGFDAAVSALMSGDEKSIDAVKRWMQLASTLGVEEEATMRYASCLRHQISLAGSQARAKLHTSDDDFSEALVHVFGAVADGFQDFLSTIGLTCTTEQSMSILRAVQEEADLQASRLLTCFEQAHTRLFQTVIVTDASFEKYTQGLGRDILAKGDVFDIAPNYSKDHGLLAEPESCRSIQGLRSFAVGIDLEILRLSIKLAEVEDRTDVQRVSSFVDDIFYVAGRLLMRSLAGNDVHSVCATVNNIANVLATEVLATMAAHVQHAQPAFAAWFESSRRQDAASEKPLNGNRACESLPHALNNICYSKTCVQELSRRVSSNFDESDLLTNSISHLSAVCTDLASAENVGAGVLVETLMPFYYQLLAPLQTENFNTDLSVAGRSGWVDHFVDANRDLFA
ncbi:MAG: hypothetical protein KVP17_000217 [Porospora cf. gigantea B]|uniref:uncharacterized protein n=1 Tax=Porospora cf. gigantea B TaxID=2853592 RepID=UPI0035717A76|nr:MAG: hypothetical protein KVP17_000217 [Porospora cf. gigantea B]